MTTSVLSSLKVTARPKLESKPPVIGKRMKLIEKLEQQHEIATCMIERRPFEAYREKMVKDPETGERKKERRQISVRPWYYDSDGHFYLEIKVNNKPIELDAGKPAIDVGEASKIPETIATVIMAVESGELDSFLLTPVKSSKKPEVAKASSKAKA